MADTIRSLTELNSLLADNTSGAISAQDIRDLMVSQMVHVEIGSGAKAAITLGTGFEALDFTVAGVIGRGLSVDTTNKWIIDVPVDMKAEVSCEIVFRGVQNNDYEFAVFKDPAGTPDRQTRLDRTLRVVSNTQIVSHSWATSLQLNAGDTLQMGVRADGLSFEMLFGLLRIRRIGVE